MSKDDAKTCTTVGKTLSVQGPGQPLLCIAPAFLANTPRNASCGT